jgi:hypothetical protein
MKEQDGKLQGWRLGLAALLVLASSANGREKPKPLPFEYAAGTENLLEGCKGKLEMAVEGLTFQCPNASVTVPYSSITLMQYRPDVSRKVRKLKIGWKVRPRGGGGKKNRYFAVLYENQGMKHAIVLQVAPLDMRPYLAEIDLKSGKRVEVKGYEEYESFR